MIIDGIHWTDINTDTLYFHPQKSSLLQVTLLQNSTNFIHVQKCTGVDNEAKWVN